MSQMDCRGFAVMPERPANVAGTLLRVLLRENSTSGLDKIENSFHVEDDDCILACIRSQELDILPVVLAIER